MNICGNIGATDTLAGLGAPIFLIVGVSAYSAASASRFPEDEVVPGVLMPARAVRLVGPVATTKPPTDVFRVTYSLEMIGVDAGSIPAKVINLQTLAYGAAADLVGDAMGYSGFARSLISNNSVPARVLRRGPFPAARFGNQKFSAQAALNGFPTSCRPRHSEPLKNGGRNGR